jgi:hypothetical protein
MSASGGDEGHPGTDPANFGHDKVFALLSAVAKSLIKNAALQQGSVARSREHKNARGDLVSSGCRGC